MLWISLIAIVTARILKNRKDDSTKTTTKNLALLAAAAVAILGATGSPAEAGRLAGDDVRDTIGGRTVVMQAMGASMPIAYRSNGTMSGSMQGYVAAMAGESKSRDSGKWWIKGSQLCQRWNNWLGGKTYCFSLQQRGATIHWTSTSGHRGTARVSH